MAKTIVKKKWFKVIAPKLFNERVVGEIPTTEAKLIIGRIISANLATLTDDMRKQNLEVGLLIDNVEGDKGKTTIVGMKLLPTSIKRLVRKGKTRIDQTVKVMTKDEQIVTIKVLLITITIVKSSVSSALHHEVKKFFIKKAAGMNYSEVCEMLVTEAAHKEIRDKLSKIYPLKVCEIREFKLERSLKAVELRRIKAELVKENKKPEIIKAPEDDEEISDEAEQPKEEPAEIIDQAAEVSGESDEQQETNEATEETKAE